MTTPLLEIGKINIRRTLKEKLTSFLLEEKLISSLNSSLKQSSKRNIKGETLG